MLLSLNEWIRLECYSYGVQFVLLVGSIISMSFGLLIKLLLSVKETLFAILAAAIGWLAHYIYDITKEWSKSKHSYIRLSSSIFLAWFVGYIVYHLMPVNSDIIWPVVSIAGFSTTKVLPMIETLAIKILEKYINNKL